MKNYNILNRTIALLLGGTLAALASCQSSENTVDNETTSSSSDTTVAEQTETEEAIEPSFEACNYDGATFHIYAPDWGLYRNYFFADEQTGDAMNDAIYERTLMVEEYLGIDITHSSGATEDLNVMNLMQQTVMSGDDAYQLVLTHCIQDVGSMLTAGLLYDWNNLEYCDLSQDYWNQSCNNNLSINGHQYYAVSDFMLPDPNCVLFNKGMIENYSLDDPYELVRSGEWTLEKMIEMGSAVTSDLDGNSVWDINDQYGIGTANDWYWNSLIYSSGLSLIDRDEQGNFELAINNDDMYTLVEIVDNLVNGSNDAYLYDFNIPEEEKLMISRGQSLFQFESFNRLNLLRDSEVEYGILPYPKLKASQDGYYTNDWSGLMAIPKTITNPEMVGKACELLAIYSRETTIPAYYDLVLGTKLSRDEDSREMLELIFDNIVYDPGVNYFGFSSNIMPLFYLLHSMVIREGSGDFASWYARYAPGAESEIKQFVEAVSELEA